VADRLAQTVGARVLEAVLEPHGHPDSYGSRPGKSAIPALGVARPRGWRTDGVLALASQGFLDHMDPALLLRALRPPTACPWGLLYGARWFQAPVPGQEGPRVQRGPGVPPGGCRSPVLAHLFLPEAFAAWRQRAQPSSPFERQAADRSAHCPSAAQARWLQARLATRLAQGHLARHPDKTRMVSCTDADRRGPSSQERFACLGSTLRPRRAKKRQGQ